MYELSGARRYGVEPRVYDMTLMDSTGSHELGAFELKECERIKDDYFGKQVEIVFQGFMDRTTWNLPEGIASYREEADIN